MKTAENFVKEMESSNILMAREYTFKEYVPEITQFQSMICKLIAGDNFYDHMRFDEALFIMESTARKKGLRSHPAVHNGVLTMKKLVKDMNITMSGANGENFVFRTLEFLERPNTQIFRNVYISDGQDATELDAIVLTDGGVIILEVKKVKTDLAITEDGRLVLGGDECYEKAPLAEKMALKRRLLKKHLERAVAEKGLDLPVSVDSLVVFSAPKGQYINVDDRYRKEKHCFRTGLNKRIENYIGYAYYKADHLAQLSEILSVMATNVKRFEPDLSFDEVRHSLAEALAILQGAPEVQETPKVSAEKVVDLNAKRDEMPKQPVARKAAGFGYAAASVFAGLLISGAAALLNKGVGHA